MPSMVDSEASDDEGTCTLYAAAKRARRHQRTIRRWIESGILEAEQSPGGGYRISIASLDQVAAESQGGDAPEPSGGDAAPAGAMVLASELGSVAKGMAEAVKALTASSVRREELYLDHMESLLDRAVGFAAQSQERIQSLVQGWEKSQSEATERQLMVQSMVNSEERKNIALTWAMEAIPEMFRAGKATKKLLDIAKTLTDEQIGAMGILLSEDQVAAIKAVVPAAPAAEVEAAASLESQPATPEK